MYPPKKDRKQENFKKERRVKKIEERKKIQTINKNNRYQRNVKLHVSFECTREQLPFKKLTHKRLHFDF